MDSDRFDAWTRRRFGLGIGVGGAVAGLLSLSSPIPSDAGKKAKRRKKRRRKRCLKKNDVCTQGGKRRCCKDLRCDFPAALSMRTHCCARAEGKCGEDFDCCVGFQCNLGRGRCEAP
jgi:hypothetical protein